MRISDWSSDVCSSDLRLPHRHPAPTHQQADFSHHRGQQDQGVGDDENEVVEQPAVGDEAAGSGDLPDEQPSRHALRSEEHTSELQSLMRISYAVFCLKQKNDQKTDKRKDNS